VDAEVCAQAIGERVLANEHLAANGPTDLMLYDRGAPPFWLFVPHLVEQRQFCARMPVNFSNEVTAFLAGGVRSALVAFNQTLVATHLRGLVSPARGERTARPPSGAACPALLRGVSG